MEYAPTLYNSMKLSKHFRYMECKRNKWDREGGGGGGCLQRRKIQVAGLDRDEIEMEQSYYGVK